MSLCGIPTPTIPNIFKYKLYRSLPAGLPVPPVVVVTDPSDLNAGHPTSIGGKAVELDIQETSLKETDQDDLARALEALIHATDPSSSTDSAELNSVDLRTAGWLKDLLPELERLAASYHFGNFVVTRGTGEKVFESMPLYARIGMHLLFYGRAQILVLNTETVGGFLKRISEKQGAIYDSAASVTHIPSFIKTYSLSVDELLEPDILKYRCFNDFFARRLKPNARPVRNADDPVGICSAADSRLAVYQTFDIARQVWVKGRNFTVPELLGVDPASDTALRFDGSSLAIFRLAPQDYHRFHCPIDGTIDGPPHLIQGDYYTVNPQAINQPAFDVLTANVRSVLYMTHGPTGKKMAFIPVGALLVGSIVWDFEEKTATGKTYKRGEEMGCFRYGGSTIVCLFEKGMLNFDIDLVNWSHKALETLVQVGESIGTSVKESCRHA
ncbi:hypothetical protein CYLTODRAFT_395522 [Cylindrobasidium torrendii FP15055 ss-10]|uniref:phosphatidylserine decarboxylase n=1 Tax=Cylindrobasidium torrendii FP15055 ss-10 TaxID=1314674 RepID=A0A0D7BD08_9AGAR|nr:hypothetical protein CYLTODRAFT_395522 [Cylindrobasidium torrendii FP15055 ss-10]